MPITGLEPHRRGAFARAPLDFEADHPTVRRLMTEWQAKSDAALASIIVRTADLIQLSAANRWRAKRCSSAGGCRKSIHAPREMATS